MTKLKAPVDVETAFATYRLTDQIGEGGAGRVYGGTDPSGTAVAVNVLTNHTTEKRRRFKNEIAFLQRNRHRNIVSVIDHGVATGAGLKGPFYVMPRLTTACEASSDRRCRRTRRCSSTAISWTVWKPLTCTT